jgi:hypothetical protein
MQLASTLESLVTISFITGANLVQSSSQESCGFERILPKQEMPRTRL